MWEKVFCIKKLTSNEGSYSNDGLHFGFFFRDDPSCSEMIFILN